MSATEITQWMAAPRFRSMLVAAYYLLAILTGAFILFFHGKVAFEADMIVTVLYIAATSLLYILSGSANRGKER